MKKLLYFILLFTATTTSAQYVTHGPQGGLAYSYYQDAARIWLAANTGIYYSDDYGISWNESAISPSTFSCDILLSVAASGNELYAGSQQAGVYHSVDKGATWSLVNTNLLKGVPYTDMEIVGPNALTIRGDSGILYRTPDHGTSWIRMNFAINNASAQWLSVRNNVLYVNTNQGLFTSVDNGATYTNINANAADIGELVWANDTAYVGTVSGIRQSVNYGVSFSTVGLAGRSVRQVAVFGPNIFATVRSVANQDTLKYSTDAGLSFNNAVFPTSAPFGLVNDIAIAGTNVLAGTNYGIYKSPNSSISFGRADSGFHATVIRNMAVNGLRLYAATFPMGLFYSPDSADSWKHNGDMAHGVEGNMFAVDAKNQYVHAGGSLNYYRSSDFGLTWTSGATGLPPGTMTSVYASKASADVLLIRNGDLFRSSDDGGSFAPVASGVPAGSAYLIIVADTALFIAANGGLYKGNSSFAFTPTTGITGRITSVVYRDTAFFASTEGNGIYYSTNGSGWKASTSMGTLPVKVNGLAVKSHALIAATDDGLYNDSTGIWTQDSLRGKIVYTVAVMAGKVYAGTCGGVWSLKNLPSTPVTGVFGGVAATGSTLQIYPNPSSGDFQAVLTTAKAGNGLLTLRDMMGRTVLRQAVRLNAGRNELHVNTGVSQLSAGIYLVQVAAENQVATQRIMLR